MERAAPYSRRAPPAQGREAGPPPSRSAPAIAGVVWTSARPVGGGGLAVPREHLPEPCHRGRIAPRRLRPTGWGESGPRPCRRGRSDLLRTFSRHMTPGAVRAAAWRLRAARRADLGRGHQPLARRSRPPTENPVLLPPGAPHRAAHRVRRATPAASRPRDPHRVFSLMSTHAVVVTGMPSPGGPRARSSRSRTILLIRAGFRAFRAAASSAPRGRRPDCSNVTTAASTHERSPGEAPRAW